GLLPARFARDRIVTIDASDFGPVQGPTRSYDLHLFSSESVRLVEHRPVELGARPDELWLLDGRVLITAGEATLVIDATRE
ncbi:MAG: hypothetical protein VYC34_10035, partial [Planctomycetota bacterium]|nr:hypothetical protein [Planctomycetota bacterium]